MDKLKQAWEWMKGKKTYAIAGAMALYALLGWALGRETQDEMMKMLMEAAAFAGLRAAK